MKRRAKSTAANTPIQSLAVLCSGGDAPGMNAAIRAVVRYAIAQGLDVFGIYKGYSGLLEGHIEKLSLRSVANIIQRGGTILKTDRCLPFHQKKVRAEAARLLRQRGIDALVVIGGEGSFTGAHLMGSENDFPVIGIPGTIDNDVYGSEYTVGFDTAVNTALDAIDKIRDTASSHDRVFLIEVMGRTSTEITTRVAVCGGAETVHIPGQDTNLNQLIASLKRSKESGKLSSIVIVAEGEHPGHTDRIARELRKRAGLDPRVAILGHVQRGGSPTALDRFMASLMGAHAADSIIKGKRGAAVAVVNGKLALVPFTKIIGKHKKPDQELLKLLQVLAT